jgi:RNA polymerase sigma factor (sigma-70 family)
MNPSHPQNTPAPQTLTTRHGVTVIVRPAPPPAPTREPEVPARFPTVVIRPPERPAHEGKRDAFVRMLDAEHGTFIAAACRAEGDVTAESIKDMAQRVLIIAGEQFDKQDFETHGPPANVRGWLVRIVRNEACNHRRVWRLEEAVPEADALVIASPTEDPEGTAQLAEQRAKLFRYLDAIPQDEAEVVLCIDLYELSIEQTAKAVGRPWGTVAAQLARARKKLEELAKESKRATEAGERRR